MGSITLYRGVLLRVQTKMETLYHGLDLGNSLKVSGIQKQDFGKVVGF